MIIKIKQASPYGLMVTAVVCVLCLAGYCQDTRCIPGLIRQFMSGLSVSML